MISAKIQDHDAPSALSRIRDGRLLRQLGYIGGHWSSAEGDATFDVRDPSSGELVAKVANFGSIEAGRGIDAAEAAFASWKALLPQERSQRLRAWHREMLAAREDLATLMTIEQGKPLEESRGEIDYAASFVEWYAEEAKRSNAEGVTSHLIDAQMQVSREPLGVAALITPWNFPCAMVTRKASAALAAGCTTVLHPSSYTPLSALALAELAARADLPPGVLNVVPGDAAKITKRLCEDERVRVVSFTGSTEIGRLIAGQCAPTVKRLVMELGGNAPLIVFDDADLDRAVDIAVKAKFATSGQDCLAANRIYVQRGLYSAFCEAFAERIRALRVGHGLIEGVEIGPLMHEWAVRRTHDRIADATARGARMLVGAAPMPGPLFVAPTLLVDTSDEMAIMREEQFAPLACVAPFDTEAEVIARANATEYGLVAYVVTENGARSLRLSRALEYGMVAVNRVKLTGAPIPFGGVKQSGMGREGARHGLEAFTDLKYTCFDLA